MRLPQGYTVVDLDTDPFTFDRSQNPVVDLIEPEGAALEDFSGMSYLDAFDAMVDKLRREYAFTEYKSIDWDALHAAFRPHFEAATRNRDSLAYRRALRDFLWQIPDGHVSGPFIFEDFQRNVAGGFGMLIRETDDGRVLVTYLAPGSEAARAGIALRAEIVEINGRPVSDVVSEVMPWTSPFSTTHNLRLNQLRDAIRFPLNTRVEIAYKNPGDATSNVVTLVASADTDSWAEWWRRFSGGTTGYELPVEYEVLDNGYVYASIYSFLDNDLLAIQLWERMIQMVNGNGVTGLVIDMRQNSGGNPFLAEQMAAYFFDEPLVVGGRGIYNEELGEFYFDPDPNAQARLILPPENLRFRGKVAVLIGPNCASACERFAYDMSLQGRAAIVGYYPTAGLGGGVEDFLMPGNETVRFTKVRSVDAEGNIHIEGKGVAPTIRVPVTEATLFAEDDPVLAAAIAYLDGETTARVAMGGALAVGDRISGVLEQGQRVRYVLRLKAGDAFSIYLGDEACTLDTVLRVYSTDEQLLGENDDVEDGKACSGFEGLGVGESMVVILEVGTSNDALAGAYVLDIVDLNAEQ
ncbi:MAG: S41 family peptidase [Anaerolineae bacterium]|nr:S41 family peptidase [Anaerolineae bacterium]